MPKNEVMMKMIKNEIKFSTFFHQNFRKWSLVISTYPHVKARDVAQPIWLSGWPTIGHFSAKTTKNAV